MSTANRLSSSIRALLVNERAKQVCVNKGKSSTTPPDRLFHLFEEELASGRFPAAAVADLEVLLASTQEKRRLTIDWRGSMLTHSQLIQQTARRVGLVAPELPNSDKDKDK